MTPNLLQVDKARAAFPVLVAAAGRLSANNRDRLTGVWYTHEDLVKSLKDAGIKENARSVIPKILKPLQVACLEAGLPDLSSVVVKRSKGDVGALIQPAPGWWDPYVDARMCVAGDVPFWFAQYRQARDYSAWPETLVL